MSNEANILGLRAYHFHTPRDHYMEVIFERRAEQEASGLLFMFRICSQQKRPAPAAMVELKQKRLRTLAPSPLQGLPSQDLQEEDWEQEDKDEDMGPRLEHSPSVQAGELKRG